MQVLLVKKLWGSWLNNLSECDRLNIRACKNDIMKLTDAIKDKLYNWERDSKEFIVCIYDLYSIAYA